jgi:hypothetical protein
MNKNDCYYPIKGTNDCGDNSDEQHCWSRMPRRLMTAAVIGVTVCMTLFIIVLACSCKLFHLRIIERRTSFYLLNSRLHFERRQQIHRSLSPIESNDIRRMAPPSYNQTVGLIDETDEQLTIVMENVRSTHLSEIMTSAPIDARFARYVHRTMSNNDSKYE